MSNIGIGTARTLIDSDGDALDDGAGKLNVNATIGVGSGTITTYTQDTSTVTATTLSSAIGVAVNNCKEIIIQADFDNASFIMVGDGFVSGDDTRGIRLQAGDMISLPIAITANVSVRGPDTSQKYNVTIIT
jgi:hypothetical protein